MNLHTRKRALAWVAFSWSVFSAAVILIAIAFALSMLPGCTIAGYDSETTDEFWPNGQQKTHTVKRRVSATNISRDAPAAAMDALDMGADFFTKHASALLATTVPTILLGGGFSAVGRSKAKRERDNLRQKHEYELKLAREQHAKERADEYAAGVLAGKAGATS